MFSGKIHRSRRFDEWRTAKSCTRGGRGFCSWRTALCTITAALICWLPARAAVGQPADGYMFAPVDFPGADGTAIPGIKSSGIVVGGFSISSTPYGNMGSSFVGLTPAGFAPTEGFTLSSGGFTAFPGPLAHGNFLGSEITAINNSDQLGRAFNPQNPSDNLRDAFGGNIVVLAGASGSVEAC